MSKTRLIFATGNQGKVNEFKQMLGDEYEILSMKDIGVDIDIEENGTSFEENAVIKAKAVMGYLVQHGLQLGQLRVVGVDEHGNFLEIFLKEPFRSRGTLMSTSPSWVLTVFFV